MTAIWKEAEEARSRRRKAQKDQRDPVNGGFTMEKGKDWRGRSKKLCLVGLYGSKSKGKIDGHACQVRFGMCVDKCFS